MSIVVECTCGKKYKVGDQNAGKKMRCKACNEVIAIPTPQAEPADEWDDFGGGGFDDFGAGGGFDDFGDEAPAPKPKPKSGGKGKGKSGGKAKGKGKTKGKGKSPKKEMAPAVKYSLAAGIVVLTAGLVVGILYMNGTIGGGKTGGGGQVADNGPDGGGEGPGMPPGGPDGGVPQPPGGKNPGGQNPASAVTIAELLKKSPAGDTSMVKKRVRVTGSVAAYLEQQHMVMFWPGEGRKVMFGLANAPTQSLGPGDEVVLEGVVARSDQQMIAVTNAAIISVKRTIDPAASMTEAQMVAAKPEFSVSVESLFAEFSKDEASLKKYDGKIIECKGRVDGFHAAGKTVKDSGFDLKVPIPDGAMKEIVVRAGSRFVKEPWAHVGPKQLVSVKGSCKIQKVLGVPIIHLSNCVYTPLEKNPTLQVSADKLLSDATQGADAMRTKYSDNFVVVSGARFQSSERSDFRGLTLLTVWLTGSQSGKLKCSLESSTQSLPPLKPGQQLSFYGKFFRIDPSTRAVEFDNCRLILETGNMGSGSGTATPPAKTPAVLDPVALLKLHKVGDTSAAKKRILVKGKVAKPFSQGWIVFQGDGTREVACHFATPPASPPAAGQTVTIEGEFTLNTQKFITLTKSRIVTGGTKTPGNGGIVPPGKGGIVPPGKGKTAPPKPKKSPDGDGP